MAVQRYVRGLSSALQGLVQQHRTRPGISTIQQSVNDLKDLGHATE